MPDTIAIGGGGGGGYGGAGGATDAADGLLVSLEMNGGLNRATSLIFQ